MNNLMKLICVLPLIFPFFLLGEESACIDFLSAWNKKPKNLKFLGCEKVEKRPAILMEASYAIQGADAKAAEDLLHNEFNLERLRFACCGWETRSATYQDKNGDIYDINMYSSSKFKGNLKWENFEFLITIGKYIVLP